MCSKMLFVLFLLIICVNSEVFTLIDSKHWAEMYSFNTYDDWNCVSNQGHYYLKNDCDLTSTIDISGILHIETFFNLEELPLINNISRINWEYGLHEYALQWDNFTMRAVTRDNLFKISTSNMRHFNFGGASLYLSYIILEGGSGEKGGSIYAYKQNSEFTEINLMGMIFRNNQATKYGGAVYVDNGIDMLMIGGSLFKNNTATDAGGALFVNSSLMDYLNFCINNTFEDNRQTSVSGIGGGAIYLGSATSLSNVGETNLINNFAATNKGHQIMLANSQQNIQLRMLYMESPYATNNFWSENSDVNNFANSLQTCSDNLEVCSNCSDVSLGVICQGNVCDQYNTTVNRNIWSESFLPQMQFQDRVESVCIKIECNPGEEIDKCDICDSYCNPCTTDQHSDGTVCQSDTVTSCSAGEGFSDGGATSDGSCTPCDNSQHSDGTTTCQNDTVTSCSAGKYLYDGGPTSDGSCTNNNLGWIVVDTNDNPDRIGIRVRISINDEEQTSGILVGFNPSGQITDLTEQNNTYLAFATGGKPAGTYFTLQLTGTTGEAHELHFSPDGTTDYTVKPDYIYVESDYGFYDYKIYTQAYLETNNNLGWSMSETNDNPDRIAIRVRISIDNVEQTSGILVGFNPLNEITDLTVQTNTYLAFATGGKPAGTYFTLQLSGTNGEAHELHFSPDGTTDYTIKPDYIYVESDYGFYDYNIDTSITQFTQTWDLKVGWNWVAMSVQLDGDTKINNVFSTDIFEQGDTVLTLNDGSATYFPAQTGWSGGFYPPGVADTITMDSCRESKFKMASAATIQLTGTIPSSHTFDFPIGWFWTGLPISTDLPINDFLPDIWEQGDTILTENEGSVTYFPAQTGWAGGWYPPTAQLTHFKPGILYKFKKATAVQVTYTVST